MFTLPSEIKSKETTLNHRSILKNKQNRLYFVRFLGWLLFVSEGFLPMMHHPKLPERLKVTDGFKGCEAPRGFRTLSESVKRPRMQRVVGCLCVCILLSVRLGAGVGAAARLERGLPEPAVGRYW